MRDTKVYPEIWKTILAYSSTICIKIAAPEKNEQLKRQGKGEKGWGMVEMQNIYYWYMVCTCLDGLLADLLYKDEAEPQLTLPPPPPNPLNDTAAALVVAVS